MLEEISELIRTQRKKKKWSQQQLAQLAGLDRTTIGALERDDYSDIGIRKVQRVLEVLGLTLAVKPYGLPSLDELKESK
ncbi:helix-turn-helix transcriptional regulator [Endozoicomonas euniceicola]|uniref:Helix-turn-helix domain-containing protein n=1 Tax=Endozoicomonas euniceicola TaxID=1234143 RepID=A0ABY6GT58_9GAMM|nr:helix-turn-helix domain-containing protein [Endozoicomonas euniceicola]UYM15885.1 helix-turn-helix domain-containing protein [Endozoicomonas euniceicola]